MTLAFTGDVVIIALLAMISVVLVAVFMLNRWRLRRRDVRMQVETTQSPEERAANQIRLATAGADLLEHQGYDVGPARAMLAEADRASRRHDYDGALRLTGSARERLVALRNSAEPPAQLPAAAGPSVRGSVPGGRSLGIRGVGPGPAASAGGTAPSEDPATGTETARPRLAPLRAEAHFAMSELRRELASSGPATVTKAARREAEGLLMDAASAYERGEFSEAWRLALKGQRRLGAAPESVPPSPRTAAVPAAPASAAPALGATTAQGPAAGLCRACGRNNGPNDLFCRGCGQSLRSRGCPQCGAPADPEDRFCGTCGSPVS